MIAPLLLALVVQVPASLTDAFGDLARAFERSRPGVAVQLNTGGSHALARQVDQGAPADVMASADQESMDFLERRGRLAPGTRAEFAGNRLVLVVRADGGLGRLAWRDLPRHPGVKRVAVGEAAVPAGRYTRQVFRKLGIGGAIGPKLVPCADVRQALTYASLGEVDAAVVYATDALAAGRKIRVVDRASPDAHEPIVYPIAVVKASKQQALARAWIDLVLSGTGQRILTGRGFLPRRRT